MSKITLQFLGSGDAFGSGGRLQSCLYVETEPTRFLIDCGASALSAMKRFGVNPAHIDTILLTHMHGDHFGGIPFLIPEMQLISKRTKPLTLAGPPGFEAKIRAAMELFFPGSSQMPLRFELDFVELFERQPTPIGPLTVTAYPVQHSPGTNPHALRVDCGAKVIAYSGDTEWVEALLEVAQGADLFICETYFYDKKVKYHLDYQTLMAYRSKLGCKRLIVTHMHEDMLARLDSLETEWAEDGKQVVL